MAQVINTNIASLNSQRHLNNTQDTMRTAMERLSSGLRINSAKDDAAGLAISNRMTAQINGMDQAARNANDGISLAQTGEGALQQMTNNLQRMRELAVQSRNATNATQDRESLDAEFQQLLSENDRLAKTTAFNGRNILDGSLGTEEFQVGANVGETISVDVSSSMRTNSIGNHATADYALNDYSASTSAPSNSNDFFLDSSGDLAINGVNVASVSSALTSDEMSAGRGANSAYGIAEAINLGTEDHGVTATAEAAQTTLSFSELSFGDSTNTSETYTLEINGKTITQQTEGSVDVSSAEALATQINNASNETGVGARVDGSGKLVLSAEDGRNIEIKESVGSSASVGGFFGNTGITATGGEYTVYKGSVRLDSDNQISVANNDGESQSFSTVAATATDTTGTKALSASDILTAANSDAALQRIDSALSDVDSLRGTFGAIQSRFESTVSSLETSSENLSAARSRIQDADFAAETAKLSKAQVLQQAGTSMLAQANQQPQSVLSLLQ
ncbi:B-type flagellin [wastewater metagenome]|uniref:B-type flagellin n=2 Tax=unclassified sequences TaxID=12908 RepID=A0A5B8R779_9ZZZZ|nr:MULTISPECIES: flagellin [Arhodomonas]MCS4502804.1 flagellin [Arhodomonas aquaeolei]QEA03713.1 B-type flagellin [uncultured organism]